jgi:large subunit ribosomal protein L15
MPLRIPIALPIKQVRPRWHRRLDPTFPCLPSAITIVPIQNRSASILANLSDNPRSYKPVKRRGRGPASGLGKTSGRGHKGQLQHGKVPAGFEGGQTPQHIVHGSRGFTNVYDFKMQRP